MGRIIVVLTLLTLTACAPEPAPDTRADATPARTDTATVEGDRGVVLFVGTSLTAGYGVGVDAAFPARIQELIDSAGMPFRVSNAGISGETSAGGLRRVDWVLQQPAEVLVVELGANDGLRGIAPREMRRNIDALLTRARELQPGIAVVLVGMEAPPNLGDAYTEEFRRVFPELAREHDAVLVPFLLDSVAARPELNIDDGIHPNATGHRILARTVWRALAPALHERMSARER